MNNPTPHHAIDLNCDLGESDNPAQIAIDAALLAIVTSANIACGGHAGDEASMTRTVRAAMERAVAVGAHPSYPDRANFGRVEMDMDPAAIEAAVAEQVRTLDRVARSLGVRLSHAKPHGALYHAAMSRMPVADAIARAVRAIDPAITLVGLAGAPGLARWRELGSPVAAEAFADRRYEPDGTLRSRTQPGALIETPAQAADQAVDIALGRGAIAIDGRAIAIRAETICIHGDTPRAPALAAAIRGALEGAGLRIERLDGPRTRW